MSYELQLGATLGENLRRICVRQIEAAIEAARGKHDGECSPVHQTRKHLKKARAVLRLVRKEIPREIYRGQHRTFRDAGRLISDLRDAEVRVQTARELEPIAQGRGRVAAILSFELENFMAAFAGWEKQAVPMLRKTLTGIDHWTIDCLDATRLACAVQATYKDARDALAGAQRNGTPENFHQFRSEVKRLCFQLRILRPINAMVLRNLSAEVAAVGRLLGRAHDLSFLGQRLREENGAETQWQDDAEKLLSVAEIGEGQLNRGAATLGQRFFLERPRDFGRRLTRWLEDWQENQSPYVAEKLI